MSTFYEGLAEIFEIEPERVDSNLALADVSWDSMAVVSTIALVDEEFNVVLGGQSLASCQTVGDIEKLIDAKRAS